MFPERHTTHVYRTSLQKELLFNPIVGRCQQLFQADCTPVEIAITVNANNAY